MVLTSREQTGGAAATGEGGGLVLGSSVFSPLRALFVCCLGAVTCGKLSASTSEFGVNPFSTAVPIWGQTSLIPSELSPKRNWGPKRVNEAAERGVHSLLTQFHLLKTHIHTLAHHQQVSMEPDTSSVSVGTPAPRRAW